MNDQFLQGVIFDWNRIDNDSYLNRIKAFKGIEKLVFNKPITFFVGEKGSGKSTLLEALAVAHGFNPEGGTKNYVFSTHDTHSELCDAIRISKGYRKEKWGYFLRNTSCTKRYNDESFRDGSFGIHGILSCSDCNPFFMEWSWCNYFGWSIISRRLSAFVQHGN